MLHTILLTDRVVYNWILSGFSLVSIGIPSYKVGRDALKKIGSAHFLKISFFRGCMRSRLQMLTTFHFFFYNFWLRGRSHLEMVSFDSQLNFVSECVFFFKNMGQDWATEPQLCQKKSKFGKIFRKREHFILSLLKEQLYRPGLLSKLNFISEYIFLNKIFS